MNKKNTSILFLLLLLLLGACTSSETATVTETDSEPTAVPPTSVPEPTAEPETTVPQRIVSMAPSVTEILFAIGAGDQIVGRTDYDNYPADVGALPSIGGISASSISIETIISMEPDLVIAGSQRQQEVVDSLAASGIETYMTAPASVDEILVGIQELGDLTGHSEEAAALLADMDARITAVTAVIDSIPADERVTVFYEVWHEPLTTTSGNTFVGELIEMGGGSNIFGDLEETYPNISAEQLVEYNPAVILGPSNHGDQLTTEIIDARPGWENLTAVKEQAIYIIDGDIISRAGPRIVDALEQIAQTLYPTQFGE